MWAWSGRGLRDIVPCGHGHLGEGSIRVQGDPGPWSPARSDLISPTPCPVPALSPSSIAHSAILTNPPPSIPPARPLATLPGTTGLRDLNLSVGADGEERIPL